MKKMKLFLLIVSASLLMISCSKQIEEKQINPNSPTSVPPNLQLGTVLTAMSGTGTYGRLSGTGSNEGVNSWDGAHRWNQYHCSNYDYYDNNVYNWTNGNFDPYLVINNVMQMENEALTRGAAPLNAFKAIGRFVRAYYFYNMTSMFGDVPLTNALQGVANGSPTYTPQIQVFQYVLSQLDTANSDMASLIAASDNSLSPAQDLYFGGNLSSWQKVVNSFAIRVLVSLSKKSGEASLNIPGRFAAILGNPAKYPVFTRQLDDMKLKYNPGGANTYTTYPFNPSNFGSVAQRFNMAQCYVKALTTLNDARVFITCEPAWSLVGTDTAAPCKYNYFAGASTGEPLATMYNNANMGLYSFINRYRYYSNFTGEPNVLVGYRELCFNIAEGIERGWATGSAEDFYKKGIVESMAFYGIDVTKTNFTAYFLPPGNSAVTQTKPFAFTFDFNAYYGQLTVALSSTSATAIGQIVLQKYISSFQNSGYEGYYNARRTGVPLFDGGSGVGNNGVVPVRWAYPVAEQSTNTTNWSAALQAQGFSSDNLNQQMWLIK